jgi:hypothetical protein
MKWLAILCLIVVLEIPLKVWDKMPSQEQDRQLTTAITEFCSAYCKKYNIHKFRIRLFQDKKRVMLDIVPEETQI